MIPAPPPGVSQQWDGWDAVLTHPAPETVPDARTFARFMTGLLNGPDFTKAIERLCATAGAWPSAIFRRWQMDDVAGGGDDGGGIARAV